MAAATLVVGGMTTLAAAQPTAPDDRMGASAPTDRGLPDAAERDSTVVTLLSGHRVSVTDEAVRLLADPDADLGPVVQQRTASGRAVVPVELLPLVPERLDPRLFDVDLLTQSAEQGDGIPLIVDLATEGQSLDRQTYTGAAGEVTAATGLSADLDLPSIGAFSTRLTAAEINDGAGVDDLLAALEEEPSRSGVDKVWLSAPVTKADEDSNPQIGAPEAWERGLTGEGVRVAVLDTGIDTGHPDLDEAVVAEADFSGSPDPGDRIGHGTHVAGIVAGSGDGAADRQGVAYGADLLNGKVFDDEGFSDEAIIIEAMEWAVEQDADIVNMSLGGGPSDGTDPVATALDALTEESGTLFVVSAGNEGFFGDYSVSTPATADHALAVANVDKSDVLAEDSSVGPRFGDSALKPDIAAPGVDIIAARAEGTDGMNPVDELYTGNSGTSMAAPHVAGAAAILLQEDPELDALDLKARLMGSSVGVGHTVWQEGAGRVDIPAALNADVHAETPSLSFGLVPYPPEEQEPVSLPLTLRNDSDESVTLELDAAVTGPEGDVAPEGLLSLSAPTLTIPAGDAATVDATLTPAAAEETGLYSGVVTATMPDGATVRVPLGADLAPLTHTLTLEGTDFEGRPAEGGFLTIIRLEDGTEYDAFDGFVNGTFSVDVVPGTYLVSGGMFSDDGLDQVLPVEPGVVVEDDTTVAFDARDAEPFTVTTHRPSTALDKTVGFTVLSEDESAIFSVFLGGGGDETTLYTEASGKGAPIGTFEFDYTETRAGGQAAGPASLIPRLPYSYQVAESSPALPTETDIVVDETTAATVRTTHHTMSDAGSTPSFVGWSAASPTFDGGFGVLTVVDIPGQRLEYLTGDRDWSRTSEVLLEDEEDFPFGGDLSSPLLSLAAGEQVTLPWNAQVHRPGLSQDEGLLSSVLVVDDLLLVQLPLLVDAHGNASYFDIATEAEFELWGDGELLLEEEYPYAEIEVGEEPVDYRMSLGVDREAEWWQRSTSSSTEWTFTTGPGGEDPTALPLLDVFIQPQRLDAHNRVTRTVDLDLEVAHQVGAETDAEITEVTFEWSNGGDWQPAELDTVEPGRYTTRLDLPAGTETADLRVSAQDSDGATVTTEVEQALVAEASVSRSAGADRYETAAATAALHGFSDVVYLASGEQFPDALSVGGVAGALEAPVLLTQPDNLPTVTEEALLDAGTREVRILGGVDAVESGVEESLTDLEYEVTRVGGTDRYATAALLAEGSPTGGTVVVASGEVYADALAGGPLSAQDGRPVLLVKQDRVPASTAAALADLAPEEIVLLGGEGRIDPTVEAALADVAPTTRVAGADRYGTASLVAEYLGGVASQGTGTAYLASGLDWPDALTLGARAGAEDDPILLSKDTSLPSATATALVGLDVRRAIAAGEEAAISDEVLTVVAALLDA